MGKLYTGWRLMNGKNTISRSAETWESAGCCILAGGILMETPTISKWVEMKVRKAGCIPGGGP